MKDMKNCKIVQDLLPNYIEKLTNDETNKFVECFIAVENEKLIKPKRIYE